MAEASKVPALKSEAIDQWLAADDDAAQDPDLEKFLDAAAVLSGFAPDQLHSTAGQAPETDTAIALVDHSVRLAGSDLRQLRDAVRQDAIVRLGSLEALRHARAANPGGDDPLQRGIDMLIAGTVPSGLSGLFLADLLGLQQGVRWLATVSDLSPPDPQLLSQRIEAERILQPMRRLVANGFVGREAELAQLRSYVGVLASASLRETIGRAARHVRYLIEERPPLFLFGPGGIGKSTLLAKFILDHADPVNGERMPFIYLDFDRASLDPRYTYTLMVEAVAQVRAQFPELIDHQYLEGLELQGGFESAQISKGTQFSRAERVIEQLANLLDQLAERNDQPVLFVLDTFEEAQTQGPSAVLNVWNLLGSLMRRVEHIRVVVAGRRSLPQGSSDFPHEPVEISSFDEATAVRLLDLKTRHLPNGPIGSKDAKAIFNLIRITTANGRPGAVPLSLALAARIVLREGLDALKDTVKRRRLFAKITAEQQQGMLNTRVLQHLHSADPDLGKLIDPGLIVRRITPAVIRQVLVGPCGIGSIDDNRARELFEALTREFGLVDADRENDAVWHLPAVRRAMLPLLKKTLGEAKLLAIHKAAVAYYTSENSPTGRAEELFHRLNLADPAAVLDPKWSPELAPQLRSAYDELEGQAKLWLAGKLGLEVDEALRARADLGDWEKQAQIRASSLLASGLATEALTTLRERSARTEASTIPVLEADALLLLGRPTEARDVVLAALQNGETVADAGVAAALLTRLSTIDERDGRTGDALQAAEDTIASSRLVADTLTEIGAWAAVLRLRKKLDIPTPSDEIQELIAKASRPDMQQALRRNPAILRELAAALGPMAPTIVADALELGMDRETLVPVAGDLHDLISSSLGSKHLADALARLMRGETGVNIAGLGREFANFLRSNPRQLELVRILAGTIAANVLTSVNQVVRSQPGGVALDEHQQSELSNALSAGLKPGDFEQLVYAVLDVAGRSSSRNDNSYENYVGQAVQSLTNNNRITLFLEGMLRSPVVGSSLRAVATRLLAQRGGLDQPSLAIDLNDLNGLQRRELAETIAESYDRYTLEALLSNRLKRDVHLATPPNATSRVMIADVVRLSQREGWTDQLITAIQAERPDNPRISGLISRLTFFGVDGDRNLAGRSLERTVTEQTGFQDVSHWASALTALSGQVCRIEGVDATPMGTGFLVGPDLVLTTYHVVEQWLKIGDAKENSGDPDRSIICRFDYMRESGVAHLGLTVRPAAQGLVRWSRHSDADHQPGVELPAEDELDYALLRLSVAVGSDAGPSGKGRRGWIDAGRRTTPVRQGETLFILQHPRGEPMRVSAGRVLDFNGNGTRIRYDAGTFPGSAGSPCVDTDFNLIALHHAGHKFGPQIYNQGIPISLIIEDLRRAGIELPMPDSYEG
ncbi:trypsin-like peptidase domain-containing protein [Labrys neptuniae]